LQVEPDLPVLQRRQHLAGGDVVAFLDERALDHAVAWRAHPDQPRLGVDHPLRDCDRRHSSRSVPRGRRRAA